MKGTEHFTRTITEYLNQRAMTNPLFAPNLMKPNKNIEECITYILKKKPKQGRKPLSNISVRNLQRYRAVTYE